MISVIIIMVNVTSPSKRKVYRRISTDGYYVCMWVSRFDIKLLKFHLIFINTFVIKFYFQRKGFLYFYFYMGMIIKKLIAQLHDMI